MRKIYMLFPGLVCLAVFICAAACTSPELTLPTDVDEEVEVTFRPCLDGSLATRSIGDASSIDQLRVGIYKETSKGLRRTEILTKPWSEVQKEGVSMQFDEDEIYRIVFWAEDKDNTAYQFKDDGTVVADYSDYVNGGFSKMEELDAFYATSSVVPGEGENIRKVTLTRPMGQLNFADSNKPENGVHTAKVTFHSLPVAFNPFTGAVKSTDHIDDKDDITFVFSDFPGESLYHNGSSYHFVSCNYIFAPAEGISEAACTVELVKDGTAVTHHEFKGKKSIVIEQRKKVNMIDYMVPEPEVWSQWNGKFPTICTLVQAEDDPDCYLIDDAEDIAWLADAENAESLGEGMTFRLTTNIDMGHKPGQKSMKLPAGSVFEGNDLTIKGINMMVGLFGDKATNLTVRNLIIDDAVISSNTDANRGVLANTVCGSGCFTNVLVANSSVSTANGAAGGMIGYVSRISKSDRSEILDIVFDNCHVINTSIESEGHEGYFIGMFRGYDNNERLTFKSNCSVIPVSGAEALNSYIMEGNEAVWIAGKDFSMYNGWLGCEECYRGMVYFDESRFIAKWDGVTQVTPLLADPIYDDSDEYKVTAGKTSYMIYSAFDLAGARNASSSPLGLYFKENVDMNGQGKDGKYHVPAEFAQSRCESEDDNWFKRFYTVRNLDGQNNTIYNLYCHSHAVSDGSYVAAFIYTAQKGYDTVHKNLNFRNCCSVAPVVKGSNEDLSYGAIFIQHAGSDSAGSPRYTMENIHIYDSKVFALQHSGILAGLLYNANAYNCSVNNCHIENYICTQTKEPFVKEVTIAENEIEISAEFYSYGEIGGLFGNIMRESNVVNCHVRGTTIHAYGEPDKEADMASDGLLGKLAIASAKGLGFFLVPGRHVSTMIGDIRTRDGETITITGCTVDAATRCTAEHQMHNSSYPYIGQAYYIQFADTKGKVIVDGQELTLADGNKNTKR